MYYELQPAYGRDYKSAAEVKRAWQEGKDFLGDHQLGFKPVNLADIPKPCTVMLRYLHNTRVTSIPVR
jgi:hypothetical protein